jgi:hypothetical protein
MRYKYITEVQYTCEEPLDKYSAFQIHITVLDESGIGTVGHAWLMHEDAPGGTLDKEGDTYIWTEEEYVTNDMYGYYISVAEIYSVEDWFEEE